MTWYKMVQGLVNLVVSVSINTLPDMCVGDERPSWLNILLRVFWFSLHHARCHVGMSIIATMIASRTAFLWQSRRKPCRVYKCKNQHKSSPERIKLQIYYEIMLYSDTQVIKLFIAEWHRFCCAQVSAIQIDKKHKLCMQFEFTTIS